MSDMIDAAALRTWAASEAGARALWQAWHDGMRSQFRIVERERERWGTLYPQDQVLDGIIAQTFVESALRALEEVHSG
jgi:hypothetical protein